MARIVERQHLPIHGRVEELALLSARRAARHLADGALALRLLRWLGLALLVAVALLFAFGRPVAWTEAALIIWDVAAGGQPTLWQKVTDRPSEYPARWADGEGDVYAPADARARRDGAGAGRGRAGPRRAAPAGARAELRARGLRRAGAGAAGSAPARSVAARCRPGRLGAAPVAAMAARPAARRCGGVLCRGAGRSSRRCETDAGVRRRHRRLSRCGGRDPLRHHRRFPPARRPARAPRRRPTITAAGRSCSPMPAVSTIASDASGAADDRA